MYSNYRLKLFVALFILSLTVTFTVSFFDYLRLKEQIVNDYKVEVEHASISATDAIFTIEKLNNILDPRIAKKMKEKSNYLIKKYEKNENFSDWDFSKLAKEIDMDIYILDEENVIRYSNVDEEVGLDFAACCPTLNKMLHKRRQSGKIYIDETDVNQLNNAIKKFSYQATPDGKYLIELGYDLEKELIFQEFDFLASIDELVEESSVIHAINVLNYGGQAYGRNDADFVPANRIENFKEVRQTNQALEHDTIYHGKKSSVLYVPIVSPYDKSETSFKVLEIIYANEQVNPYLQTNFSQLIIQIIIVFIFTLMASSLIARWFSKPIYFAYHDSLTKLKNRAAFDDKLQKIFEEEKVLYSLYLLDLDNFKQVNDTLGHAEGDRLLRKLGKKLTLISTGVSYRLGGDEFAILEKYQDLSMTEDRAELMIQSLNQMLQADERLKSLHVSVSMGVASMNYRMMKKEQLYMAADHALYEAKQKGKCQYEMAHNLN